MYKRIIIVAAIFLLALALPVMAGQGGSGSGHGGSGSGHGDSGSGHGDSGSSHGSAQEGFMHNVVVDGIRAEFQVMNLSSMNIKDPDGNTHHVMVKFFNDDKNSQIDKAAGKIKIIGPSKKEQTNSLKDYGGIMAANFTFSDTGKYGIICVFKVDGQKHVVKFWYPHHG